MEGKADGGCCHFMPHGNPCAQLDIVIGSSGGIFLCIVTLQCSCRGACEVLAALVLELVHSSFCKSSSPHSMEVGCGVAASCYSRE